MDDPEKQFLKLPGRLLLDTCVLNAIYDGGSYIWKEVVAENSTEENISPELEALRKIFVVNQRASFQFVISPLTIAEIVNIQSFYVRDLKTQWLFDVLNHWLITVDDLMDRESRGGTVRARFKLTPQLQELESKLMTLNDFRRDPFDRLLLLQYKMANCDVFLTIDVNTIWKHRKTLNGFGIQVIRPSEYWNLIQPWANLWV